MIESRPLLFLIAWGLAAVLQLGLFLHQRRTADATVVDAGWAGSLVAIALIYGALGAGSVGFRLLIVVMCVAENLRLMLLVLGRVGRGEDGRYQELRARWEARGSAQARFFVFFQAQAFLAAVVSLPILLAASNDGHLGVLAWTGAAVWLVASMLEGTADRQLARYKGNPNEKGKTLRSGLWRYSRHPNYFFQWLTWVAYALVALEAPQGWLGLIAPALMLYLILCVTGVPPAEESSLRSRGDDYRAYQRETSVFVPWFPRGERT